MSKVTTMADTLPIWFFVGVRCNWCAANYHGLVPQGISPDHIQCSKCDAKLARITDIITQEPMTKKECFTYIDELEDKDGQSTKEENGSWGGDKSG